MTDRNTKRLLDKIDLLERANKTQLELIEQLRRKLAEAERKAGT